jgi:acetoin utilization protein AcuB
MTQRIPDMLAVMTPFPYTIDVHSGIAEARAMMAEHEIRHLAVTEGKKLIGIVSQRDLDAAQTPARGAEPDDELSVGDAFAPHPYMVDVTVALDEVLENMWDRRIGATLVLKAGKLVGILTAADVCRLFAEHLRRGAKIPADDVA